MNKKLFISLSLVTSLSAIASSEYFPNKKDYLLDSNKKSDSVIKLIQDLARCGSSLKEIKKINKDEKLKIANASVINSDEKISICSDEGCFFQDIKKEKGPFKIKIKNQETFFKISEDSQITSVEIKNIKEEEKSLFKEIPLTKLPEIKNRKFLHEFDSKLKKEIKKLHYFKIKNMKKEKKEEELKKLSESDKKIFLEVEKNCAQILMKLDLESDPKSKIKKSDKIDERRVQDKPGSIEDATKPNNSDGGSLAH